MKHDALYQLAHEAGMKAVSELHVTPMVVTGHANPIDDSSPVTERYFVPDGVCGFAWVTVRPANCSFAKWLKAEKGCRPAYSGGMMLWISDFNQSMQKKEAYAQAFAKVLTEHGILAHADSRMD